MRIVKGDKIEYMGNKGIVLGTCYMYMIGKRYMDIYLEDTKEYLSVEANLLKKI